MFEGVDSDLLELLKGLLEFNPHFRLTAKEALQSKVFDKIRVPFFEEDCPSKITQKINQPGRYVYNDEEAHYYSVRDYKKMFRREIEKIRKMDLIRLV